MSGLAKILAQAGHRVTGSDLKPGPALFALAAAGVETWLGSRPERATEWDLVVASSAVPERDPELRAARAAGVEVWLRPRLLAAISAALPTLGVSGTHGKTTGTAMLVTALRSLGRDPSFMVGGEMADLATNAHLGEEGIFALEADEAFGTFLSLTLGGLVVTNVEADHLDHYGDFQAVMSAFERVASAVTGPVVVCADDPGSRRVGEAVGSTSYGTAADATWRIKGLAHGPGSVRFVLRGAGDEVPVAIPKPGEHVARNAAGVLALLGEMGMDVRAAAEGLAAFAGVRRRFEVRGRVGGVLVVDDYAHHPTEVRATIAAACQGHSGRVMAVFQPHRFTRTADQGALLGEALATTDRVFVTDVYPAGEAPIPGVTGRLVAEAATRVGGNVAYVPHRIDLARAIAAETEPGDLVLLLGAGDITLVADELLPMLAASR